MVVETIKTGTLCNKTDGGEGCIGSRLSNEQREQRSQYMKLQPRRLPVIRKPVSQYALDGEYIKTWPSAKEASENTPANRSYITQVCKGKRKSAGGYLWAYENDPVPVFSKKTYRPVAQFNLNGERMDAFRSLTEAQNRN